MKNLEFDVNAFEDLQWWVEHDRKIALRIFKLIQEVQRTPYEGTGQPEPLKHELSGCWSRRIHQEHRLCTGLSRTTTKLEFWLAVTTTEYLENTWKGGHSLSWAKYAVEALQRGEVTMIRPRGHSMKGKVNDGDLVTLAPCDASSLSINDIVLVRVHGNDYLHLVKAVDTERFQIGNNRGGINGWVRAGSIYGIAIKVEPYSAEARKKGPQPEARGPEG